MEEGSELPRPVLRRADHRKLDAITGPTHKDPDSPTPGGRSGCSMGCLPRPSLWADLESSMTDRMWPLADFRFDEAIEAAEVYVDRGAGLVLMARDEAIALAHERGVNLVAWWPPDADAAPSCLMAKVSLPLRWERVPVEDSALATDERLWFEAPCGRRDFIVGNGHTFVGRIAAWCPHDGVGYNVSLGGMGAMSDESRYFVAGFLAGSQPAYPTDAEGDTDEADLVPGAQPRPGSGVRVFG